MKPSKEGQIVKFHTPLDHEDPSQLYVVLEIIEDGERSRAKVQALNTGLKFAPVNMIKLIDLEVTQVDNSDLIGHKVTINKADYSQIQGRVIKVSEQKAELSLSVVERGVETNVLVTVIDNNGIEHIGTLFIDQE
ncbi:hypothetical protein ASF10_14710 [Flavobacterium sp. Leaf82]|uniref:hypothetical protein n=1 Tax=Flavobacterium sp. Leaf82 TaxID=1736238 RepID=UPI000701570F|nr:hypothetical protein [Flavobacterium sp. Leaf82]KQO20836.1 hypothetical protein ASF10_14710 [Flavobacterium sp. Leaf82]